MSAFTEEQARAYMHKLLGAMSQAGGSDLFIASDFPPSMKSHGNMQPLTSQKLTPDATRKLAESMMNERQREEFAKEMECNFAISIPGVSRFRVNIYVQQQCVSMVIRTIASEIPNFDKLKLPVVLKDVVMNKRGLVLVVGATGSGKSTTLYSCLRAVMTAIVIFLMFASITAVIWQGALDVQAGNMTGGTIAAFVLYGGLVAGSFGALAEVYGDVLRGAGAAGRLGELLNEEPGIAAPANPIKMPEPPQGRVTFDHVTFRYPTRPEVSALDDFSLDIRPGETVAVVGPSGAGKTTLFQLIQRFYDPASGTVSIDGVALPATDPAWARARIAMVPQETIIFAASARDNLRYGRWDATDDALWAAAENANAAEFLKKLPEGLDTFMGEGGARLSGGQRQRLAIARAILRDAPILLLDEATSALDAESERLVQDAFDRLMHTRTTIVIAHRLATVRAADRIVVMDGGQIVEKGTHDQLARSGGLYERLARLQFQGLAA